MVTTFSDNMSSAQIRKQTRASHNISTYLEKLSVLLSKWRIEVSGNKWEHLTFTLNRADCAYSQSLRIRRRVEGTLEAIACMIQHKQLMQKKEVKKVSVCSSGVVARDLTTASPFLSRWTAHSSPIGGELTVLKITPPGRKIPFFERW